MSPDPAAAGVLVGVEGLASRVKSAARLLLALDYDGTLAPFHVDRLAAVPLPAVPPLLEALRDNAGVELVLISGRILGELETLSGVTGIELWGSHGFERRLVSGERDNVELAADIKEALDAAEALARGRGWRLERKIASVAVHSRGLSAEEAGNLHAVVRAAWAPYAEHPEVSLHDFNGGVELRAEGIHKGTALSRWLDARRFTSADVALFVGDDRTDEDAFAVLERRGGVGIKVGPGETCAAGYVPDCPAVAELLARLLTLRGGEVRTVHG